MRLFVRMLRILRKILSIGKLEGFVTVALVIQFLMISLSDNLASYLAFSWNLMNVKSRGQMIKLFARPQRSERMSRSRTIALHSTQGSVKAITFQVMLRPAHSLRGRASATCSA
jgi:hypothetical protein